MDNEYEFLRREALKRAQQGRRAIKEAEQKFYRAIGLFRVECLPLLDSEYADKLLEDITGFPSLLRSVMDAQEEADQMLGRALRIRQQDQILKSMEQAQQIGIDVDLPEGSKSDSSTSKD